MGKAGACAMGRRKLSKRVLVPASTMVLTGPLEAVFHLPSIHPNVSGPDHPFLYFPLDGEKRNSLPQIPTL